MRKNSSFFRLRFVATLVAGLSATHWAVASETPGVSGHVRYTTNKDVVERTLQGSAAHSFAPEVGPWQVAGVDGSILAAQSAMIGTRPVTFELPAAPAFDTDVRAASRNSATDHVSGSGKSREPGFWATCLSTLALGLFFFLRRLA